MWAYRDGVAVCQPREASGAAARRAWAGCRDAKRVVCQALFCPELVGGASL